MRRGLFRAGTVAAAAAFFIFGSRTAHAQLHWDVAAGGGLSKRFLSQPSGGGASNGGFGPVFGVQGHVALMPLFRIGAYVDHEIAPTGEPSSRHLTSFGARVKFMPPLLSENWHAWAFFGFGYAALAAPGYHQTVDAPLNGSASALQDATVKAAGGSFFEVPIGVGAAWRFRRPFEVYAELGARIALATSGSYYGSREATITATGVPAGFTTGTDAVALMLTVGIGLDQ